GEKPLSDEEIEALFAPWSRPARRAGSGDAAGDKDRSANADANSAGGAATANSNRVFLTGVGAGEGGPDDRLSGSDGLTGNKPSGHRQIPPPRDPPNPNAYAGAGSGPGGVSTPNLGGGGAPNGGALNPHLPNMNLQPPSPAGSNGVSVAPIGGLAAL